jgi:Arc/MetJ family transcription regulator
MRTTVTLDDDLIADAAAYSGLEDKSKLINLALDSYVKRMAARRLIALGGTMPDLVVPARNSSNMTEDFSPAKEAARALVAMGGTMPDLAAAPRKKSEDSESGFPPSQVAEEPTIYPKGKFRGKSK